MTSQGAKSVQTGKYFENVVTTFFKSLGCKQVSVKIHNVCKFIEKNIKGNYFITHPKIGECRADMMIISIGDNITLNIIEIKSKISCGSDGEKLAVIPHKFKNYETFLKNSIKNIDNINIKFHIILCAGYDIKYHETNEGYDEFKLLFNNKVKQVSSLKDIKRSLTYLDKSLYTYKSYNVLYLSQLQEMWNF